MKPRIYCKIALRNCQDADEASFYRKTRYNKNDMHSLNRGHQDRPLHSDHVVVGLSGGVDSAVTAALLQEEGHTVHGVVLNLWRLPETQTGPEDGTVIAARGVAAALDIDLIVRDLQQRFYDTVVAPFMKAYRRGSTPNPCVLCNPQFKFRALIETADALNSAWIATGHYARVVHAPQAPTRLYTAANPDKDQSYALYRLRQPQLQRLRLPLGDLETKARVRALARAHGIPSAEREDSQDLCFVGGGDYRKALRAEQPDAFQPGPIYSASGERLGKHDGLPGYTVGQRSGLGIASTERLYVIRKDPEHNALVVGPRSQLQRTTCTVDQMTFTTGTPPAPQFRAVGRIRYHAPLSPLTVEMLDEYHARVTFEEPQWGVAPGQSLVLYRNDEVVGGGLIAASEPQPI